MGKRTDPPQAGKKPAVGGKLRLIVGCGAVALLLVLGLTTPGTSTIVPGGGSARSDCYGAFDVLGADGTSRKITCVDGDPACDLDGQCQGVCTFDLAVCLNQIGVAGCSPHALRKPAKVRGASLAIPSPLSVDPICGSRTPLEVRLRGRKRNKARTKKLALTVVTTGTPKVDKDTVLLRCEPRAEGSCPTTTPTTSTTTLPPRAPADPTIYAIAPGNLLLRFKRSTPATVTTVGTVSGIGAGETIRGIDIRPRTGQLYALAVPPGAVNNSILHTYAIDPISAAATVVGQTAAALAGAGNVPGGCDVNPVVDRVRYVNTNDENARLNPNNGALAGNDTDLTQAVSTDIIGAAYDRSFDRQTISGPTPNGVIPTTLYLINRAGSALARQGSIDATPESPNLGIVTAVGPLGVTLHPARDAGFDIAPTIDGQVAVAALTAVDDLTRLYTIDLATGAATPVGLIGDGTTPIYGLAVARGGIEVVGADAGDVPRVTVFEGGTPVLSFLAYGPEVRSGVRVAAGDVTGDGILDVVTGPGPGGLPLVRVFDGITGEALAGARGSFLAADVSFTGGVFVAAGDVNGAGFDDIVTGAGAGGEPRVRVFSGRDGSELLDFLAYDASFQGGVHVGAGDTNLDGLAELVTGPAAGAPPLVKLFTGPLDGVTATLYAADFAGGVHVALGDVNGDGRADLLAGPGPGGEPLVRVLSGVDGTSPLQNFLAFEPAFRGGVRVGTADTNGDGRLDILVGAGPGGGPQVRAFDGVTGAEHESFFAFAPGFLGGVFVGGARE